MWLAGTTRGPLCVSPEPALEAGTSPVGNRPFDIDSTTPLRTSVLSFSSVDKSFKMVSGSSEVAVNCADN